MLGQKNLQATLDYKTAYDFCMHLGWAELDAEAVPWKNWKWTHQRKSGLISKPDVLLILAESCSPSLSLSPFGFRDANTSPILPQIILPSALHLKPLFFFYCVKTH